MTFSIFGPADPAEAVEQCGVCDWDLVPGRDCDCNPDPCPSCGIWLRWQETLPGGYCQHCWFCENCDDVTCSGCGD